MALKGGLHMKLIDEYFETAMEAWSMMQKTSGDEGAEWAERLNATSMNLLMN